jgi:plasmid rolling circle replication initiator protein Rep
MNNCILPQSSLVETDQVYLTDLSPKDKPWDKHAAERDQVRNSYLEAGHPYASRMSDCSQWLEFALRSAEHGEVGFRLQDSRFCRVRHCPVCQWRRSLKWRAKFFQVLPKIRADYPTARFIFLTLTVRNCQIHELHTTLTHMNKAWNKFVQRKQFPALGWIRSVEVTKGKNDTAHPHFHALLMVPDSYFKKGYISQEQWTSLWQSSLKIEYIPIVDVRTVKPIENIDDHDKGLFAAVCETLKYSVKPSDLIQDAAWLVQLTKQLHKTRTVATGGVFKTYLANLGEEPDDLIHLEESDQQGEELGRFFFTWAYKVQRYTT